MQIRRDIAHAPRVRALGRTVAGLQGGCVGCQGCAGLCTALLEDLTLPDLVLKEKQA
jgi:formate hydrogenlyase subunit 6/NADH:ubiquinone oxidoreductase subunit I